MDSEYDKKNYKKFWNYLFKIYTLWWIIVLF